MPRSSTSSASDRRELSDRELLAQAKVGQVSAFREIMQRNNARLYRLARTVLRGDSEAEDVVQEAYFKAFQHISDFRGEAGISTWLTRIVLNEALGRLRHRGPVTLELSHAEHLAANPTAQVIPFPALPSDADPEHAMGRSQVAELLEKAVDALPDDFRIVFVLRAVEEMSVKETARLLGLPEATVKTRLHRAKRLLRRSLESEVGLALKDAFPFAGPRCTRMTETVLARLGQIGTAHRN